MQAQFTTEKLIEIYCQADDLCRSFETWLLANHPELYRPNKGSFSDAEVLTVVICYHLSGFKCFEYYYRQMILVDLADWFPSAPSYSYFLQLQPRVQAQAYFLQQQKAAEAARTGFYFVDSKKLPVCSLGCPSAVISVLPPSLLASWLLASTYCFSASNCSLETPKAAVTLWISATSLSLNLPSE